MDQNFATKTDLENGLREVRTDLANAIEKSEYKQTVKLGTMMTPAALPFLVITSGCPVLTT